MGRWIAVGSIAFLAACGSASSSPDGGTGSSACGSAGTKSGSACSALSDCGAQNANTVEFCDHCFAYASAAVCEAGACRSLAPGASTNVQAAFGVPASAAGAKSYVIATLDPITADATHLTCAALTSTCMYANNTSINAFASRFRNFVMPADPTMAYTDIIAADPGDNRLVFIAVTSDVQGKGDIKAMGCTEQVSIGAGMTNHVQVDLK
jgi:hypothetical protein